MQNDKASMAEVPPRPPRARDAAPAAAATATAGPWEEFSRLHDHCYMVTDQALVAETNGRIQQAVDGYQEALTLMDQALAVEPQNNEKIATMQDKIRRAKKETLMRLVDAQSALAAAAAPPPPLTSGRDAPPSYDSLYPAVPAAAGPLYPAVPEETSVRPQLAARVAAAAEDEQAAALMEIAEETDGDCVLLPDLAEELFVLPDGAQMFFVAPDGNVSAPSSPQHLRLCRFAGAAAPAGSPQAFLQVGDWTYPLIPGCSPVLHSNFGPYMFPDLERPGCHVALLLPESVSLTALVEQPEEVPTTAGAAEAAGRSDKQKERLSAWLSGGLVKDGSQLMEAYLTGAEMLSKGLVTGAEKLSQYMATGTQQLQSGIAPATGPVRVDPRVQTGAKTAKQVSVGVLKGSEFVVSQVGRGTMALASYIAPYMKRTGARLLTATRAADETTANSKMDDVLEVASGAVRGFGLVYRGLEQAATQLANSLADNTVQLVEHRYGAEAGLVTHHSLHAAGNLAMTGHNVQSLGAKGIAKRVAKDTGKHLIHEHEQKRQGADAAGEVPPPAAQPGRPAKKI
ncbi:spartin-like [Pollicipes pollicipes]|uniref:spartin-like n=1 Tax=Pollicipes pollicipes TaxID=41117 RepID=UPI00188502FE|nr:spartin-like [Pollicipes pollicipes]